MARKSRNGKELNRPTVFAVCDSDATVCSEMYPFWMQDGALAGARFDKAIDGDTNYKIKLTSAKAYLSSNNADTVANETRTHLVITGDNASGMGMFSFGDLLGSGMATSNGTGFVSAAVKSIEKVRADVAALLALDSKPTTLDAILETQWSKLEVALDKIFGTNSAPGGDATPTSAVRTTAPREEDILDDIDDILAALSSEANFVAATHEDRDNRGVFRSQELGAGKAADTFNRLTWSATATMGMTGSTRYGTVIRKMSTNAKSDPTTEDYGAFSYSTMQQTVRTADVVAPTGIASYSGGTEAITGTGKAYSGRMDLQVRFGANSVSGVVSNLMDAAGLPWQHNFADVDRIVLDDATLRRNATWANNAGTKGTVFYTADSGLLRPVGSQTNTFSGRLLGQGADAGSEANGTWSVGDAASTAYLAGGFGVVHVGDTARPLPSGDDGSAANSKLFTMVADVSPNMSSATIADGMLTVKARRYGWTGRGGENNATEPTYKELSQPGENGAAIQVTAKFNLADMAAASDTAMTVNGPKHIDAAIAILTAQREQLAILRGLGERTTTTRAAEATAWKKVTDAVQFNVFGGLLPVKLEGDYGTDTDLQADALDLIDRVLDALSSNAKLEAALDPEGTGIFNKYFNDANNDQVMQSTETTGNYRVYDSNDRRNEVSTRTIGQVRGEREYKVISALGTTEYTRFGFWRRESTTSARRNDGVVGNVIRNHGGPGTFAYSPLDRTRVGTLQNLAFPAGGSARYTGETIALQNTVILSGTAQVDVSWWSTTGGENTFANLNGFTTVGKLSLTISGLANAAGDPLSQGGTTHTDANPSAGSEIADIVFPSLDIKVGDTGDFKDNLIVATRGELADGKYPYKDELELTNHRYRRGTAGQDIEGTGTASVKALFVGQGVDGPLGVIGTWTLKDGQVGRIAPDGSHTDDIGANIYGAFGVEIP